jgi:hypothetical protein
VQNCTSQGNFAPGQLVNPQNLEALSVSGSLWWSASNWKNRIVVPLSFSLPANACSLVTSKNTVDLFGSELFIQASNQWRPHFCLDPKAFSFTHVQTSEPEARNLLATSQSEAALTSFAQPDGYGRPVVNAPLAVSGFAIAYSIDDAQGQPYANLRLTPRLLAKLLTESYPAILAMQHEIVWAQHNPLNISLDPEFTSLNPGIKQGVSASEAASELLALSSNSDVMEALTSYINADPTARAWLDGTPDQWGMVVNPAYAHIALPVTKWPLLATDQPTQYYNSGNNDCLYRNPVPFGPLVAAPLPTLEVISQSLQFAISNSTTQCFQIDGTSLGEKLVAGGRQTAGYRFMLGIVPLADVPRFGLRAAALETAPHTFVDPSTASLSAAAKLLTPDEQRGVWTFPYATLHTSSGADAYPGTMVIYAAIPTSGLSATNAKCFATLLTFAAGDGQNPGGNSGQLPEGYLPMTKANHVASLANYTARAALAVAQQDGSLVSLSGTSSPSTPTTVPTSTTPTTPVVTVPPVTTPSTTVPQSPGVTAHISLGSGASLVVGGTGVAVLVLSTASVQRVRRSRRDEND